MDLEFEWDEAKNARCVHERGFGFDHAIRAFLDPKCTVEIDERRDYGEPRHRLFGRIDGRLYVVVYTFRGRVLRIVSARKANPRECRNHDCGESAPDA